jgi:hypothetical protein
VSTNYERDNINITISSSFAKADPTKFRVGDIVEVQMTVVAVPIRNNRFKVINQLRSVALLTGKFTNVSYCIQIWMQNTDKRGGGKEATAQRLKSNRDPRAVKPTIKRKVGYNTFEDEVAETRKKMVTMNVEDD